MAIIGVDLDGVSGNYIVGLRENLAKIFNLTPEQALIEFPAPLDYAFSNWKLIADNFHEYHAQCVEIGLYENMPMIEGASEILWKLNDFGHHLRVITSRFVKHGQNQKVVSATSYWLDKHDIPYRDLMFIRDKIDVYADIYIDDAPSNIEALRAKGRTVIVFDAPYNQHVDGLRAYDWNDVYQIMKDLKIPSSEYVLDSEVGIEE